MAQSSAVVKGDLITKDRYNDLRDDVISTTLGHRHDGTNGREHEFLRFPATQAASAGANDLDDYEEGTWTPVITFATAGDLSVVYGTQAGAYRKIGDLVVVQMALSTTTFTHTTASGNLRITGLPFTADNDTGSQGARGTWLWQGITKSNYTEVLPHVTGNQTYCEARGAGSGQSFSAIDTGDMPTSGTVSFYGTILYRI